MASTSDAPPAVQSKVHEIAFTVTVGTGLLTDYHEIFLITAVICVAAAALSLLLPGRVRTARDVPIGP